MAKKFNEEFTKYIELIISMCADCIAGGITDATYLSNLKLMLPQMEQIIKEDEPCKP